MSRNSSIASLLFLPLAASLCWAEPLSKEYAQTPWPTGHRDGSNTDYLPYGLPRELTISEHLFQGQALLWPPVTGPEGNLYVSTGKGEGQHHLHALDSDGKLLWQSPAQQSLNDLDSLAVINAPSVDSDGHVYVGDSNQLWSFSSEGELRWVSDLNAFGAKDGFVGTVLAPNGLIVGISRNGLMMAFNRDNGSLARPVFELPGGEGPAAEEEAQEGLWRDLMDPSIVSGLFNLIQGWEMEVANTPAIHPQTGRIYITAFGDTADSGVLYGLDITPGGIQIGFQTAMGKGSGTSPVISHDGGAVYAVDDQRRLLAVDANDGQILWTSDAIAGSAASPSAAPDGRIFTPYKNTLTVLSPSGELDYQADFNDFCQQQMSETGFLWGLVFSEPTAFIDSIVTLTADGYGWINVVCGNRIPLLSKHERTDIPVPVQSWLIRFSMADGSIQGSPLALPDTSEGFISASRNGNVWITFSGAMRSVFYYGLNDYLPERFAVPSPPVGGLLKLEPASRESFAIDGIRAARGAVETALASVKRKDYVTASKILAGQAGQLQASYGAWKANGDTEGVNPAVIRSAGDQIAAAELELQRRRYGAVRSALSSALLMFQQIERDIIGTESSRDNSN